ncbi:toxin glutamine deamidase domain-containing protein [Kitasatospora sp. NPDC004531]
MIGIPEGFVRSTVAREGEAGRAWISELPALVGELLDLWGCRPDGAVGHGQVGVVLPVRTGGGAAAVLKVSFPHPGNVHEPDAFAVWDGRGAVRLHRRDDARFAMLLERADRRTLAEHPDVDAAVAVAGRLTRRLAVPAPPALPRPGPPRSPGAPGAPGAAAGAATPAAPGAAAGAAAGASGAGGQAGSAAAVVGVGQHPADGRAVAARPVTGPVPPPGGGGIGQHAPGGPVRHDPLMPDARRPATVDESGAQLHQASAAWLVMTGGRGGGPVRPGSVEQAVRTLADSRPYGLPGGLGPVDPAHQAEVVRRTPAPHPDPMVGEWIEVLNGGGPTESGRANNCVDVALSAVDTSGTAPTCAAPRLPDGPAGERGGRDRAELELGTRFLDLGDGDEAHGKLGQALLAHGTGTRAVLLTVDAFGRSHTWNAVNHKGVLSYLDHQTGYAAPTPLYPADHGLWAIAVDAADRPIDLSAPLPVTVAVPAAAPAAAPEPEPEPVPATVGAPAEEPAVAAGPVAAPPRSRLTIHRTTGSTSR